MRAIFVFFLLFLSNSVFAADTDDDGVPDSQELEDGTDPDDDTSFRRAHLASFRFSGGSLLGNAGQKPLQTNNVLIAPGWDGNGAKITNAQGPVFLKYNASETNGQVNLAPKRGAIWFQLQPYWFSNEPGFDSDFGVGPGHWVTVLQTANFALRIDPNGTNAVLTSINGSGQTVTNLTATISVAAENWFDREKRTDPGVAVWTGVLLSYSPEETRLYWGSVNYTAGTGITPPTVPPEERFLSLGSAPNGSGALNGTIDEVITFVGKGALDVNSLTLSAVASDSPPGLNLVWTANPDAVATVKRRVAGTKPWSFLGALIGGSYFDQTVETGVRYEYLVNSGLSDIGFEEKLGSSITATRLGTVLDRRGKILLLVDETLATSMATDLTRFTTNLIADGWEVLRGDMPRHIDDSTTQTSYLTNYYNITNKIVPFIRTQWNAYSNNIKHLLLIGHVTIPYTGTSSEDGHDPGAMPSDLFYGDVNGAWTDNATSISSPRPWQKNFPNDGKFDQNQIPLTNGLADLEISVARIDFSNLPAFLPRTEVDLLRQYFAKNARYRRAGSTFLPKVFTFNEGILGFPTTVPARTGADMVSKIRFLGQAEVRDAFVGQSNGVIAVLSGPGGFNALNAVRVNEHNSDDIADGRTSTNTAFYYVRASFMQDWNTTNNFLRAILGTTNGGLLSVPILKDRPVITWKTEGLSVGLGIGSDHKRIIDSWDRSFPPPPTVRHMQMLGDPTLRYPVPRPPGGLTWSPTNDLIRLSWSHPTGVTRIYNIYRATNGIEGRFTRLNSEPVTLTNFVDSNVVSGSLVYMVRALEPTVTGGGSYTNISQGIFTLGSPAPETEGCCIPDQVTNEDVPIENLAFSLGNAATEDGLAIIGRSSDPILVPNANITFSGTGANRRMKITPTPNLSGTAVITIRITTDALVRYKSFQLTVNAVNDPPTFNRGGNQTVRQNAGPRTVNLWADDISPGAANEDEQTVSFTLTTQQGYLFSVLPAVSPAGTLTYTATKRARGTAMVSVQAIDSGGAASAVQNFTITLGLPTDGDADGIPDDFEEAYGLDPESTADATSDADGDGFTNLQEYRAATNPIDSASLLDFVQTTRQGTQWRMAFQSVPGKEYSVESNDSFPSGPWQPLFSNIPAFGSVFDVPDLSGYASLSNRIYRISTGVGTNRVTSGYAGFQRLATLGLSDTPFSVPFLRPAEARGRVTNVTDNVVRLFGSAPWVPDQWVYSPVLQPKHYYMMICSGDLEGDYFEITQSGSNTLTLNLDGGTLSGLDQGDRVMIVPYWSFGTVFPGGQGVHASSNGVNRATEVFLPDLTGLGINISPKRTFYFRNTWREFPLAGAKDDEVFLPDTFVWIRNNVLGDGEVTTHGVVLTTKFRIPLRRLENGEQDMPVALPRPTPMTLDELGLVTGGVFRASASSVNRTDEAFFYNTEQPVIFRSPIDTYYCRNGVWRKYPLGGSFGDTVVFHPGSGFLLRLDPAATSVMWINEPNY